MIVSPSISQKRYIFNGDTIVGYNKLENRKIAIIFMQGDSCKEVSKDNNQIISKLTASIDSYKILVKTDSTKTAFTEAQNKTLNTDLVKCKTDLQKSNDSKRVWRGIALIEAVGIVVSILLLK